MKRLILLSVVMIFTFAFVVIAQAGDGRGNNTARVWTQTDQGLQQESFRTYGGHGMDMSGFQNGAAGVKTTGNGQASGNYRQNYKQVNTSPTGYQSSSASQSGTVNAGGKGNGPRCR